MKKQTKPMFLFWMGVAFAMELCANIFWLHNKVGLIGYLLIALFHAVPYLLHRLCVENGIWEGPKVIVRAMLILYVLLFIKNWIFGAARFISLVQHLIVRVAYQILLLFCTKNFG